MSKECLKVATPSVVPVVRWFLKFGRCSRTKSPLERPPWIFSSTRLLLGWML
jgi:hypothetical protein